MALTGDAKREWMRVYMASYMRRRRALSRESQASIELKLAQFGFGVAGGSGPDVVSSDSPAGTKALKKHLYDEWCQSEVIVIPFDGDEAGLDDPEDGECGVA